MIEIANLSLNSTQLNFNFDSIEAEVVLFSTFKGHPPDHQTQTGEVVVNCQPQLNFNFNSIEAEIVLFSTFKGHPPPDHQTGEVVISVVTHSILTKFHR